MTKREILLATSLFAITTLQSLKEEEVKAAAPKKGQKPAECFGINSCKGTNSCAITPDSIAQANKSFANKFIKSKPIECAGNSDCAAKNGFLAWTSKPNREDCFNAGGFIFEKTTDGKLAIRDRSGVK